MDELIKIRVGVEDDIPSIARVLVDTWRSTFSGRLPSDFLDSMSYAGQEERHLRTIRRPETVYLVACNDCERIVGFASGGPTRHTDLPFENELYALYVLKSHQGAGTGTKLLRAVTSTLSCSGRTGLIVWVLFNNPHRSFYDRNGGRLISVQPIALGSAIVDEVAYAWDDVPARTS
jgi:GNAT superfamily N-acetyltransferase